MNDQVKCLVESNTLKFRLLKGDTDGIKSLDVSKKVA